MKALLVLGLTTLLLTGCNAKQEIVIPTQPVPALKDSEVTQMGFGANLPKPTITTTPAKK